MVQLSWKLCLLFTNVATLLVGAAMAVQVDNACFFWPGNFECSEHRLQCDRGTIFLTQAVRGFKPESDPCKPGVVSNCAYNATCCRNTTGQDCIETYTEEALSNVTRECWNQQSCSHKVRNAQRTSCNWTYSNPSGYSEVQYVCLDDSAIQDFKDSNPMTASSLALRYVSSHGQGDYVCLVTAEDCTRCASSVLLTRWPNIDVTQYCSSLRVNDETWLPCSGSIMYKTYTLITPFYVRLFVVNDKDIAQAWAVIHADDSRNLRVECKPLSSNVPFKNSTPAPTMAPSTPLPTSQRTDSTTLSSSHGTGTSGATTAAVQSTDTSSLAPGPGSDTTGETMSQSAENTGNTAAVVGGVVGAVVVVVAVVAVVVAVIFIRRRHPSTYLFAKVATWFKGGNSSTSRGNSGRAEQRVVYAQPTSLPVYDNPAAAITDEAGDHVAPDSDYHHLGQKPTSSAPRDVTYGHLTNGNDVTDYGYDRVAKGKPVARSGDVIDNVYNTPGPPTAGSCDEDAYNVTGAAKNRAEVINNIYNTAGPATGGPSDEDFYNTTAENRPDVINNVYSTPSPSSEASPDVDYYNAAGLSQTGRDVINNHTPQSASPGQAQAHDVTGNKAGSPYELAKIVK